ncbi:hypothetical protein Hanom_Chr09g00845741 [Helianthus anomalus]
MKEKNRSCGFLIIEEIEKIYLHIVSIIRANSYFKVHEIIFPVWERYAARLR